MPHRLEPLDVLALAKGNAGAHGRDKAFHTRVVKLGEDLLYRRVKCDSGVVAAASGVGVLLEDGDVYPVSLQVEAVEEAGEGAAYLLMWMVRILMVVGNIGLLTMTTDFGLVSDIVNDLPVEIQNRCSKFLVMGDWLVVESAG